MIHPMRSIDVLENQREPHHYQQEPDPSHRQPGDLPPTAVVDEIVRAKVPAAPLLVVPPASALCWPAKRRLSESGTTMTTSGSYGHLASLGGAGNGSGEEEGGGGGSAMEISQAQSADAGTATGTSPASATPTPTAASTSTSAAAAGPFRPVAKRSNSLGHLTTFLRLGGGGDENADAPQTTTASTVIDIDSSGGGGGGGDISEQEIEKHAAAPGLFQKLGLRRHTMQHHRRSTSDSDILDVSGRGANTPTGTAPAPAPAPGSRKFKAAPVKFHHRCTMEDSIHVQIRHNTVMDDEKHEENPHLQDYLKPKQFVHMSKRESQDNLLHLETQYLRPKIKASLVVAEEESSDDENENDDPTPKVSQGVMYADAAAGTAAGATEVARTEVHDEPAHKKFDPNEPLRSCMKKAWGKDTGPRKPKRNVIFHEVTVRDYGITLGDHPNVSYGPPITLSWDYLEYDPLDIDEYEIHHPKRRNLRQMGLNYYQRRNILLVQTDYTEEELRLAWKSVKKAKQQRYITRNYTSALPVRLVEDACQSAVRKVKRRMSGGEKRSSP